ncbi:ribosome hibernation factor-recruiting GTPase MRF [Actinomycetospora termitidis]|uniref:GTP-binding protein n=1 Tax=Actinomycetospora termitidis TaxID=3053470 RepID=A0ABT7MAB8_9PSEU|nr:GTP-binding protein [Actinomycetospora sp. Odt1-22]MDL5156987.1 GTP-binding protein [Actinomycetospora sp. Odt1-22]
MPDPLVIVCGVDRDAVLATGEAVATANPRTVLVAHDLRRLGEGVVTRAVHREGRWTTTALELAHGCVSCTLREDLLPLLLELADDDGVGRVVLLLDPGMEPEPVCEALAHVVPDGGNGPVTEALDLVGVVAVLDGERWLDDAGSDDALADRGLALTEDDDRTVAQIVVGHAEFADVLVVVGGPEPWERVRRDAVLARLAPQARRLDAAGVDAIPDVTPVLAELHPDTRCGVPDDPHGPLLRGQPPLTRDVGVSLLHVGLRRPFHPQRLHEAFDVLLTGTVRVRGRVWVASRPEHALWIESAGGGLQIGMAGRWLADSLAWDDVDEVRRASASLRWDERWGDREQQLVVLLHDAEPADVVAALDLALLTDDELALGEDAWRAFPDPFGLSHTDPCDELEGPAVPVENRGEQA